MIHGKRYSSVFAISYSWSKKFDVFDIKSCLWSQFLLYLIYSSSSFDKILQISVIYTARVTKFSLSSSKYPTITINMVKRLSLLTGVFFTFLFQFCCYGTLFSSTPKSNSREFMNIKAVKCGDREHSPQSIAKRMKEVCGKYFNGANRRKQNDNNSWKKKLVILPKEELEAVIIQRPYYILTTSKYQFLPKFVFPTKKINDRIVVSKGCELVSMMIIDKVVTPADPNCFEKCSKQQTTHTYKKCDIITS